MRKTKWWYWAIWLTVLILGFGAGFRYQPSQCDAQCQYGHHSYNGANSPFGSICAFFRATANSPEAAWTAFGSLVAFFGLTFIAYQVRADVAAKKDYIEAERGRVMVEGACAMRIEQSDRKGPDEFCVGYKLTNAGAGRSVFIACGMKAWRQEGGERTRNYELSELRTERAHIVLKGGEVIDVLHDIVILNTCPIEGMTLRQYYDTLGETHRIYFQGYILYSTLGRTYVARFLMEGRSVKTDRVFRPIGGAMMNREYTVKNEWEFLKNIPEDDWKDHYTVPPLPPYSAPVRKVPPKA